MWYVYFYIDPTDNCIFYIGKGHGTRSVSHLSRAKLWIKQGKPSKYGSLNIHLMRKISQLWDQNLEPIVEIFETFEIEEDAYSKEIEQITNYRSDKLCNISNGGEGLRPTKETIEKIQISRNLWLNSDAGILWRQNISESRKGKNNPQYGKVEDEEHKQKRMKNLLAKERWNKGLKNDPRCKGTPKGGLSWNAKKCRVTHVITGQQVEADSRQKLFQKLKTMNISLSGSSIARALVSSKITKNWRVEYV